MATQVRDLSQLLERPFEPLTQDQLDHFEEYMSFKNSSVSAKNVDITETANDIIANLGYYLGFTKERQHAS